MEPCETMYAGAIRRLRSTCESAWKSIRLSGLFALAGLIWMTGIAVSDGAQQMRKIHESAPEAEVFLRLAATNMEEYRSSHGAYPTTWRELGMTYVNGPYNVNDADSRPPEKSGNSWQPKNSNYRYELRTNSSRNEFHIDAIGADGHTAYFIKSGDAYPTHLGSAPSQGVPSSPH